MTEKTSVIPKKGLITDNAVDLIQEIVDLQESIEYTSGKINRYFNGLLFYPDEFSISELEAYAKQLQNADNELNNFVDKYTDPEEWVELA